MNWRCKQVTKYFARQFRLPLSALSVNEPLDRFHCRRILLQEQHNTSNRLDWFLNQGEDGTQIFACWFWLDIRYYFEVHSTLVSKIKHCWWQYTRTVPNCLKRKVTIFSSTCLFYKQSVFQSEARICFSFSQIQTQNMLKISLSKNIKKIKFPDLSQAWQEWAGRGYQNEENFEIYTF